MSPATTTTVVELQEVHLSSDFPRAAEPVPPSSPLPPQPGRVFEVTQARVISQKSRLLIICLIVAANLAQFIINFVTFSSGFSLNKALGRDASPATANWMAAAYSLTQSGFVLISGRLGAVYGHQKLLIIGGFTMALFSLLNAFCTNYNAFIAMRALTGVGGGIISPNAVAIVTMMLPPGRSRNITIGFFAASAPIGGWLGALFSGLFVQLSHWQYLFFFNAALTTTIFAGLLILLPKEQPVDKNGKIDYIGAVLGFSGLFLFNFVWNQAPSAGWSSPSEISCLILSVVLFGSFLFWETRAPEPIMPLSIFRAPTFTALVFVVLLSYMSFGISLWYMIAWQELIRGWTMLELTIGWIPFGVGSTAAVLFAAWLVPRLAAQWIMAIGVAATLITNILLATMPEQQNYWIQTFPAIAISGVCPDFVYVAAQIIASNSVGRKQQGVAASLVGALNLYGNALGLGLAGTIETEVSKYTGGDAVSGYRAALYFGFALAVVGLILDFAWVRMPKDEREGWDDQTIAEDEAAAVDSIVSGAATATGVETASLA